MTRAGSLDASRVWRSGQLPSCPGLRVLVVSEHCNVKPGVLIPEIEKIVPIRAKLFYGPEAFTLPGNVLKMQILGAHPRPTESETLSLLPSNNKCSR